MRQDKFKVWDNRGYMTKAITLEDVINRRILFTSDCTVLYFVGGLKDKNGKEYFEGDIVRIDGKNCIMKRGVYAFYVLGFTRMSQDQPGNFFGEKAYEEGEIVGNIYENPELLE